MTGTVGEVVDHFFELYGAVRYPELPVRTNKADDRWPLALERREREGLTSTDKEHGGQEWKAIV
jgi:hypothetical protein